MPAFGTALDLVATGLRLVNPAPFPDEIHSIRPATELRFHLNQLNALENHVVNCNRARSKRDAPPVRVCWALIDGSACQYRQLVNTLGSHGEEVGLFQADQIPSQNCNLVVYGTWTEGLVPPTFPCCMLNPFGMFIPAHHPFLEPRRNQFALPFFNEHPAHHADYRQLNLAIADSGVNPDYTILTRI